MTTERTDFAAHYVLSEGSHHWLYETETGAFVGVYRSVVQAGSVAARETMTAEIGASIGAAFANARAKLAADHR